MPIDMSGIKTRVKTIPGSHEEFQGTPVRTPQSTEVHLEGPLVVTWTPVNCLECASFNGLGGCNLGHNPTLEAFQEELERHIPLVLRVSDSLSVEITDVVVVQLDKGEARLLPIDWRLTQ